jgi:hypothetical protein
LPSQVWPKRLDKYQEISESAVFLMALYISGAAHAQALERIAYDGIL